MADKARWERVLGKFSLKELPKIARKQLGLEILPEAESKKELVALLVNSCLEQELTPSDLLTLELCYFTSRCVNSVQWKAYRLEYADPLAPSSAVVDTNVFSKRLNHYLSEFYDYSMVQILEHNGCWLCLRLSDRRLAPYTCYIFRQPPSPVLYVAGVKKTHLAALLEAICLTLGSVKCTDLEMTSKNLKSLVELVSNQHSQGPLSAYRLNQVDPNPLLMTGKHLPLPLLSQTEKEGEPSESAAKRRCKAATDAFGSNPLPTLEKFTFKLQADLPDKSDFITCQVRFSGRSVLEGTKAAIAADCVSLPVPEVMKKMPSFATNSLTVEDDHTPEDGHPAPGLTEDDS